ncbi:metallophosphoesterase [Patescibacteria group bacterium]
MQHKKLIVISDLHIGGEAPIDDFECEKELISFLDYLDENNESIELVILGDFFDLWKIKDKLEGKVAYAIKQHPRLFEHLKKFGEKHKITVLGGNHDHEIVYEQRYQDDLAKYNMHVDKNQFFKREFSNDGKSFRIVGEHGNQVEPATAFTDFSMKTDSSLSYHINQLFVYEMMKMGTDKKRPKWVSDLDNVDINLLFYWFSSKYFYYELGPILKAILIPMLLLFGFAVPYFAFDIATDFYRPNFLVPLLNFLDTNWVVKILVFILYFDMVVVILLFFMSLVRKDFQKRLRSYGVQSLSEVVVSIHQAFKDRAKEVCSGKNPYKKKAHLYVNGHTHIPGLFDLKKDNFVHVDTGSWKKLMKRMPTYFHFPGVFVPYYDLNYLSCSLSEDKKGVNVELRSWPKQFTPQLTFLEKLTIKKNKNIPKPYKEDTCIEAINFPLHNC